MRVKESRPVKSQHGASDTSSAVVAAGSQPSVPNARDTSPFNAMSSWLSYVVDVSQRGALFAHALVERGDRLLEDERAGLPLRLKFPYETILDARDFIEPVGYSLLRILPDGDDCFEHCEGRNSRPIIVFDPRAGHGPGIGGFKRDSEVGMAMHRGHPVYFVAHHMQPCPEQTLAHVHHALRRFVAEVVDRHPGERPTLYGNCQAGWAVALLAADCAGVTGPTVLNGAPLSYWGGDTGVNPMRLAGGLTGGVWAARLLADLSGGQFDGAWLAHNFEQLDPGHAHFGKYRALFAHPEAERERFVEFERWWGEYCFLTRDEIVSIVENLFIGNRLEEGGFRICDCCHADLRQLKTPMLVFASSGDNITPPHQALGWVPAVWPTTEALIAGGQRIIYLLNPTVGHLGIFVSADVARREHRAILENLDALEKLSPGLYEMCIGESIDGAECPQPQYSVSFESRRVEDLPTTSKTAAFERVREQSEQIDALYRHTLGPWARMFGGPLLASTLKWAHPMRTSRLGWAHAFNPFAYGVDLAAAWAGNRRAPVSADNPWAVAEARSMDVCSGLLDDWRRKRDASTEALFATLFQRQGDAVELSA
ncbi:MAG: DUF3141 domain-containing protein [Burkholderiaceae bacterium]|nr:DUF3141 domain-containing protein [Burkholderiaceae bacterium]